MATAQASPPPTPTAMRKRKLADLNLGNSTLTRPVKAQRVYYGIDVHNLLAEARATEHIKHVTADLPTPPAEPIDPPVATKVKPTLLWTEKYRAKKFTELIGDERTHRQVMHWLKRWESIVFPGSARAKPKGKQDQQSDEKAHRKILILAGPPGLGKTTLAHVCAKQAGYEVQEINASDERSSAVVKGRIRDMVGTENVRGVDASAKSGKSRGTARPVCVVVDEVDGVVGGSGSGGEGGFVKALIDLILLDQKNTPLGALSQAPVRRKKGDRFRLMRPVILVCNDVYHPSLRPLRQSSLAEIVHVKKPAVENLVSRLQSIFDKENVPHESDGVRRLCEAAWGVSNRKEDRHGSGAGEGDMRGILVVGEWVAGRLRASDNGDAKLTRRWVEDNVLRDLAHGGGGARGLGRGGPKDIVERVFQEGAGFPKHLSHVAPQTETRDGGIRGVAEGVKRTASERLHELIVTHGDTDRIMTDCFSSYPERTFQDDTFLSKPNAAYEWLHFHDRLSGAIHSSNEWELAPYLSTPVLAFHHLFATPTRAQYQNNLNDEDRPEQHPFIGVGASWAAHEAEKQNLGHVHSLQSSLSSPLTRLFPAPASLVTDFAPYLLRMLSPAVHPVVVGGKDKSTASVRRATEQALVRRAVNAMSASGARFDRVRVGHGAAHDSRPMGPPQQQQQWILRMEPPVDLLCSFPTAPRQKDANGPNPATRYAVRQVLEQEWRKEEVRLAQEARYARSGMGGDASAQDQSGGRKKHGGDDEDDVATANVRKARVARDFFGRPIVTAAPNEANDGVENAKAESKKAAKANATPRVWITYHEGYSNAVRKPLTMAEFMKAL